MKPCPCINCLTFPICKIQVQTYIKLHKNTYSNKVNGFNIYNIVLRNKCSIITKWINSYNKHEQYNILYKQFQIKG